MISEAIGCEPRKNNFSYMTYLSVWMLGEAGSEKKRTLIELRSMRCLLKVI